MQHVKIISVCVSTELVGFVVFPMIGNLFSNTPNALSIALRNDTCRKLNDSLAFQGNE